MGLMLPHPSKADTEGTLGGRNPTLEGKMACMSVAGYAACAKSNVALDAVLDEIKVGCPGPVPMVGSNPRGAWVVYKAHTATCYLRMGLQFGAALACTSRCCFHD